MNARRDELQLGMTFGLITAWQGIFHTAASRFAATTEEGLLFVQAICLANALAIFVGACGCGLLQRQKKHSFTHRWVRIAILAVVGVVMEMLFGAALFWRSDHLVLAMQVLAVAWATILLIGAWENMLGLSGDALARSFLVGLLTCGLAEFVIAPLGELVGGVAGTLCLQTVVFLLYCVLSTSRDVEEKTVPGELVALVHIEKIEEPEGASKGLGSGKLLPGSALPLQFAIALFCYCAAMGVVHAATSEIDDVTLAFMPPRLFGLAFAVVLAGVLLKRKPAALSFPWPLLREVVFPVTVLSLMALGLLHQGFGFSAVPLFLGQFSISFFDLLITLMICYMAREMKVSVRLFTAGTYAVQGLASAVGIFVGAFVTLHYSFIGTTASTLVAMGSFLVLTAGTFWVGTDRRVQKVWGLRIEKDPRALLDERRAASIEALASRYDLTPREAEIALLLASGMRPQAIADHLCVSINTVRAHSKAVYRKLDVHSQGDFLKVVERESR